MSDDGAHRSLALLGEARDVFVEGRDTAPLRLLPRGTAEYVAAAFLARAASSLDATVLLLETGHSAEGLIITRSLVEDVCSLSYILAEPDTLAASWCDFEAERVAKYYDDLAEAFPTASLKAHAKRVARSAGRKAGVARANWWSGMSPHAMARESEAAYPGTLRFYLLLYAALCDIAHFNAPALGKYVSLPDDSGGTFVEGRPADLVLAVQATLAVALELALRLDDLLALGLGDAVRPLAEEASAIAVDAVDDAAAVELLGWLEGEG